MCVTLHEGYLRAANRGSKNLTDFKSKYNLSFFNEKTNFFGLSFLLFFLRLQIYEAIAAFSGNLPAMFDLYIAVFKY